MKNFLYILLVVLITLSSFACSVEVSVGNPSLKFGADLDRENFEIISPSKTFQPDEEFYFLFSNGSNNFESDELTLKVVSIDNDETDEEIPVAVDPDNNIYANTMWLANPGNYEVSIIINGETKITEEITIE